LLLQPPRYFWEIYELYNIKDLKFDGVYFPGMLQQVPKLLALFFVVAFGSSLDVAAIQADSPEPLDYNHELKTVGVLSLSIQSMHVHSKN
jgi:SulP family sulfate permease